MTSQPSVVCTKCGFLNQAGDQFCGSCGAFLEWEGSAVGGTPGTGPAAGAPPPVGAAGAGVPPTPPPPTSPGATAAWPPAPAPASGPSGPLAGAAAPPEAELLRCPACGVANAASRTFCQSCGARLVAAARVAPRSRDEIAAAVAAVPRTAPPPSAATPASVAGAARPAAPSGRSRGLPLWIAVVIVAGVLVGAGVIVLPGLLRGTGPVSAASSAPSAGASVVASPSASAAASASASAAASPSAKPSTATPKPLHLTAASASSVVNGNTAKYGAANAIDGNPKTSWQEGSPTEKGQWIEVGFAPSTVNAVQIRNGYAASTALYKGNQRLKDVQISIDGGDPITIRLKDTANPQRIDLPATPGATRLRITIVSTYPAVKTSVPGTPFDDAALNEVVVLGIAGG